MDEIIINNLKVKTTIGTLDFERNSQREILLNIIIGLDLSGAGESDSIYDTVNYQEIEQRIIELGRDSKFLLLEKFAAKAADIILSYDLVSKTDITLYKVGALTRADSVGVRIIREKH